MATGSFAAGLAGLLAEAAARPTVAMCAEMLWWRCHRRLIADAAALPAGVEVCPLGHDGRVSAHRVTEGARVANAEGTARLVYDADAAPWRGVA